jgi:hypothetical protein
VSELYVINRVDIPSKIPEWGSKWGEIIDEIVNTSVLSLRSQVAAMGESGDSVAQARRGIFDAIRTGFLVMLIQVDDGTGDIRGRIVGRPQATTIVESEREQGADVKDFEPFDLE